MTSETVRAQVATEEWWPVYELWDEDPDGDNVYELLSVPADLMRRYRAAVVEFADVQRAIAEHCGYGRPHGSLDAADRVREDEEQP